MKTIYPYIKDKNMYAAVMGACSYIRDTGYFHKAVSYYADKYNVDEKELEREIRKRQAAGQKGKTRKYKYFVVKGYTDHWLYDGDTNILLSRYNPEEWKKERQYVGKIIKATTRANAEHQIPKGTLDNMILYGPCITNWTIEEFDTLEAAKMSLNVISSL